MRAKIICGVLWAAVWVWASSLAFAAPQTVTGIGHYTIGDGPEENISLARERAKTEALRNATEQAGVLVESATLVQNNVVAKDEIKVLAANILQVQGEPKFKIVPVSDEVIRYECYVTALIDTDNITAAMLSDKAKLAEAAERNKELTEEVERLNREMASLKEQYRAAANEAKREQIRSQIRRNDDDFVAAQLNERGAKLCGEGRYAEAVEAFSEAIAKNPRYAYAYHNRGTAYGRMQNYSQAAQDFSQAIALKSDYATAYGGRGFANYGLDRYEQAAADFSRAIALNSAYAEAYEGRGNVYMSMGHYDEALRDYKKALALNPGLDAARQNMAAIQNAMR